MTLPVLLSIPHGGLEVPDYVAPYCALSREEIVRDGDEGAAEIYALDEHVQFVVRTRIARAIVDLNRPPDDRSKDGVIKTHTCWDVPVYREPLPEELVERLLREHYHPYHSRLTELAGKVRFAVDCHTMAAVAPPVAPDPGRPRPMACLGDGEGAFPPDSTELLRQCLARHLPGEVTINVPFKGGYITRRHGREMPWVQLELSRSPELSHAAKRQAVLAGLREFCASPPAPPG